mmetsp:Transcript_45071/g.114275  ORF Transcript_45071/g.114275 Transcript_45071/m.114275 type:complete len:300 (-) Transcript_45071:619-1518(-)
MHCLPLLVHPGAPAESPKRRAVGLRVSGVLVDLGGCRHCLTLLVKPGAPTESPKPRAVGRTSFLGLPTQGARRLGRTVRGTRPQVAVARPRGANRPASGVLEKKAPALGMRNRWTSIDRHHRNSTSATTRPTWSAAAIPRCPRTHWSLRWMTRSVPPAAPGAARAGVLSRERQRFLGKVGPVGCREQPGGVAHLLRKRTIASCRAAGCPVGARELSAEAMSDLMRRPTWQRPMPATWHQRSGIRTWWHCSAQMMKRLWGKRLGSLRGAGMKLQLDRPAAERAHLGGSDGRSRFHRRNFM